MDVWPQVERTQQVEEAAKLRGTLSALESQLAASTQVRVRAGEEAALPCLWPLPQRSHSAGEEAAERQCRQPSAM